ncbi:MAG: glutamine--fructose-6-phosphate aminotransferase, partial [Pseudomonadota bacterium]
MCGIIGILGEGDVAAPIVEGLRRLEYRGYDSAGVAVVGADGAIDRRRAVGKLRELEAVLAAAPLSGAAGVGHTRWATHGAPNERNAHPHATARAAVVHNGIIENYRDLRAELEASGSKFESDTDTEVILQLVDAALEAGHSPEAAFEAALARIRGAFAIAAVFAGDADLIAVARSGSPLALGRGEGAAFLGSDAYALAPFTNRITYLEDGDWALLRRSGAEVRDRAGGRAVRAEKVADLSASIVDKGEHRHFMAKEIYEQPEVVAHALGAYVDPAARRAREVEGVDFAKST